MKYVISKILIFCLMCLFLSQCSCNEEPKPDPCSEIPYSTAEFMSMESTTIFGASPTGVSNDINVIKPLSNNQEHFLRREFVDFVAVDGSANSYMWSIVGGVNTFAGQKWKLRFPDPNGDVETWGITLKTKKTKKMYTCYDNDDSVKTYTKRIYIHKNPSFLGTWRGVVNVNNKDTFNVNIFNRLDLVGDSMPFCDLYKKYCDLPEKDALITYGEGNRLELTYSRYLIEGVAGWIKTCESFPYILEIWHLKDTLTIRHYIIYKNSDKLVERIFKGAKIK